jgi:hypothetical protein
MDDLCNARGELELGLAQRVVANACAKKERRFNTACQMMVGILSNETLTDNFASDMEDALVRRAYRIADKMIETEYPQ